MMEEPKHTGLQTARSDPGTDLRVFLGLGDLGDGSGLGLSLGLGQN